MTSELDKSTSTFTWHTMSICECISVLQNLNNITPLGNCALCTILFAITCTCNCSQYPIQCPRENTSHSSCLVRSISWPPTPKDIPEPSHGRVFCEKFRSVYEVKDVSLPQTVNSWLQHWRPFLVDV